MPDFSKVTAILPDLADYVVYAAIAVVSLIVPGADHGMSYYVETEKYQATVRNFWAKYDK